MFLGKVQLFGSTDIRSVKRTAWFRWTRTKLFRQCMPYLILCVSIAVFFLYVYNSLIYTFYDYFTTGEGAQSLWPMLLLALLLYFFGLPLWLGFLRLIQRGRKGAFDRSEFFFAFSSGRMYRRVLSFQWKRIWKVLLFGGLARLCFLIGEQVAYSIPWEAPRVLPPLILLPFALGSLGFIFLLFVFAAGTYPATALFLEDDTIAPAYAFFKAAQMTDGRRGQILKLILSCLPELILSVALVLVPFFLGFLPFYTVLYMDVSEGLRTLPTEADLREEELRKNDVIQLSPKTDDGQPT